MASPPTQPSHTATLPSLSRPPRFPVQALALDYEDSVSHRLLRQALEDSVAVASGDDIRALSVEAGGALDATSSGGLSARAAAAAEILGLASVPGSSAAGAGAGAAAATARPVGGGGVSRVGFAAFTPGPTEATAAGGNRGAAASAASGASAMHESWGSSSSVGTAPASGASSGALGGGMLFGAGTPASAVATPHLAFGSPEAGAGALSSRWGTEGPGGPGSAAPSAAAGQAGFHTGPPMPMGGGGSGSGFGQRLDRSGVSAFSDGSRMDEEDSDASDMR